MEAQNFGRYQLIKKIATGGMGEVFLARQQGPVGFQKLVVVKRLLPHLSEEQEFINMFFDEARIAALLNHPNIAQIYDLGEAEGGYYIAMEYVHGENLRVVAQEAHERKGGMPLALKCRVVADAAAALDFAHKAKSPAGQPLDLIHRDVSPQNVIVGFSGAVKLIDFGVAKATNKITRTATGIIKGKYAYMSPEQARGEDLDSRSDIFGLGIVLYEVLTHQRLFKRENDTATLKAVVGLKVPPPSTVVKGVPKAVDAIVLKALEKDREDRYQTGGELRLALEEFLVRQRLPATPAHIAAFMADLFPSESVQEAIQEEPTWSRSGPDSVGIADEGAKRQSSKVQRATGESKPSSQTGKRKAMAEKALRATGKQWGPVLDKQELELRISGTQPTDTMHGLFFAAVESVVLRTVGPMGEPAMKEALENPKAWVDSLTYPTGEFLRLLWRAVELIAPHSGGVEETFTALGVSCMQALVRSPLGKPLEQLSAAPGGPVTLAAPLMATLQPMISPGERKVIGNTANASIVVFKEEVLPIQFYTGMFTAAFEKLRGAGISCKWEKTAASRIEMTISW
jgi:serine/threonine-protein kinase